MSDINPPNTAIPTTLPASPKNDHQVVANDHSAEATKISRQIIYDNARNRILNPNTHPQVLFISCLFFVAETMRIANKENMGNESPDLGTYSFKDIPKVFSDRHYCMLLLSYCCLDHEIREWWQKYYQPSNANTRHKLFLRAQSFLDNLAEQHASGKITEESAMVYAMFQL